MSIIKKLSVMALLAGYMMTSPIVSAGTDLKFATLAPQGTTMFKSLQDSGNEIKAKTGGRVTMTIFGGGTAGDEKDFVRKMRYGELQGAALTGVGLGMIDPQIRVLELPFLLSDTAKADTVYAAMRPYFEKAFAAKGFELLGWAEVGFVNIFSNKPIRNIKDLQGVKMWMWAGDPLAEAMCHALGITPVPLALTDVLTSLQTGMIDSAYAPPLGAIAFQWQTKTKFVTDVNLVNATGALLVAKKDWDKISPADQGIIRQILSTNATALIAQTRRENTESKAALQASGLQIIVPDAAAVAEMKTAALQVQKDLVGKLYSQELLDQVIGLAK